MVINRGETCVKNCMLDTRLIFYPLILIYTCDEKFLEALLLLRLSTIYRVWWNKKVSKIRIRICISITCLYRYLITTRIF